MLLTALVVLWLAWVIFFNTSKNGSLVGHNHTDRPLGRYFVGGNYGGNGGTTCCWSFKGKSIEVVWILSVTEEQSREGIKEERHSVEVLMPEYRREDQYLHVHFLPDNQIELAWSPGMQSPLSEQLI
ncbi:DUF3304 domain-containing protein [Halomonas sp. 707D7]|uniref:DUF3304 domain-containing protein n=1 Tax=unclassified Halomonas TaxID=2609666 RepID=UPI00345FFE09